MPTDFSAELAAFEAQKEELLKLCLGKLAVFKGSKFLGTFDNFSAAYAAGIKEWGNVPFLIQEIIPQAPVAQAPALCLGLIHALV
jgi:hypothetical protein